MHLEGEAAALKRKASAAEEEIPREKGKLRLFLVLIFFCWTLAHRQDGILFTRR